MAEQYDYRNYVRSAIPNAYPGDVRAMIDAAVALGWTVHIAQNQNIRLVAFDKSKTIMLSPRKGSQPIESLKRSIHRHANPLLAPARTAGDAEKRANQFTAVTQAREATELTKMTGTATVAEAKKKTEQMQAEFDAQELAKKVVYEGPMRSVEGGSPGRKVRRESNIATEVEYADGRRVFTCTRCDFTREQGIAMSGHWKVHVREDEKNRGFHMGAIAKALIGGDGYTPNAERLQSLKDSVMAMLKDGLDWADLDKSAEALSLRMLEWDHDRKMNYRERDPLTPEQVLDRIRTLVDGGQYAERVEEIRDLRDRIEQVEALADASRKQWEEAHAQVVKERDEARNNLRTLRELLDGLGD